MTTELKTSHYYILLALITAAAGILRFWQLGEFQQLVFDEVYFPKYAHGYLTNTYYFDVHPPLSKYLIGVGIWIYNHLPWVTDPHYASVGIEKLNAISWRWLNAVTGTLFCLIAARFSLLLHPSRLLALLIALLVATDGSFIVESRFGLNNIYLVLFGTCGLLFLAKAFTPQPKMRLWLFLSGIFLGLSYSVKWNGLGYSLAAWMIVFIPVFILLLHKFDAHKTDLLYHKMSKKQRKKSPPQPHALLPIKAPQAKLFHNIALWEYPLYLLVIPFILHVILWQPHLIMFDQYDFFEMQRQILGYHSNTVTADEHPYCSRWYSWPIMWRPLSYLFIANNTSAIVADHNLIDIHLFGNPMLFWLSVPAILALTLVWLNNLKNWFMYATVSSGLKFQSFVVLGFIANWLPWMIVSRCLFQYHYMPASLFAFMALAWFIIQGLTSESTKLKIASITIILALIFGFIYWLPFQLGIPLTPEHFYDRMWLRSWI